MLGPADVVTAPPRLAKPAPEPKRPTGRYAGAWSRMAAAVTGAPVQADPYAYDGAAVTAVLQQTRCRVAQSEFTAALSRGERLEPATYRAVDALVRTKDWNAAWALAEGVGALTGGSLAAAIGHAVIHHRRRHFDRVWNIIRDLSDDDLATHLPVEAVDGALGAGTPAGHERALAIVTHADAFSPETLVDLAGRFLAFADRDAAAALVAEYRRRAAADLDERKLRSMQLIEGWLRREPKTAPPGAIPVAIIDYQTPDQVLASGNLGDYIQTLSLLGNLVRLSNVTFTGEQGLGALATELQGRVRPDLTVPEVTGAVHLLDVNREFSRVEELPAGTWMFAFGWHMHPMYDLHYDFPYHPAIRPLFLSFHINRLDMLTDEALAYLRKYGPVGCRDWSTVDLLLAAGVDAFFTGCLTTTVDALFPRREEVHPAPGGTVGVIDLPRRAAGPRARNVEVFTHQADKYRHMSLTDGVRAAVQELGSYQRDLHRAVTRRLHAYLPLTALGVPVTFEPWSPGDVRFPGLTGFSPGDPALAELQQVIRELSAKVLERILSGASEEAVYAYWRDLVADRVAAAKARHSAPTPDLRTTIDIPAAVRSSWANSVRFGPDAEGTAATDVVLCFDQNLTAQVPVLLESMLDNASGPVRLWVLGRGLHPNYQEWLAGAFPAVPITFLPCDHIDYGDIARIPARITVSTMDRLLLPHLLEGVARVIYLDIDTIVLGDICELGNIDLDGHPIAARDAAVSEASEWRSAARKLPEDRAVELLRRMSLAHGYGRAALNAGVLVLDLDRMRRDDFSTVYLGWVERYGLHDQDVMLAYAGSDRVVLDRRWNALPALEDVHDPAVIHWASIGKPWDEALTFARERWQEYAARRPTWH